MLVIFEVELGSCSLSRDVSIRFSWLNILGAIISLSVNVSGRLLSSIGSDRTLKIFDVVSFDNISMGKLPFPPLVCAFVHSSSSGLSRLAVSDSQSSSIYLYDAETLNVKQPISVLSNLGHFSSVSLISYASKFDLSISCDETSMINYWSASEPTKLPSIIRFQSKLDTDLYELAKRKLIPFQLEFNPTNEIFALFAKSSTEKKLFLFNTLKGKIMKIFDENFDVYKNLHEHLQIQEQRKVNLLNNVEYSRRLTMEKDLEKNSVVHSLINLQFDSSSTFLFYSTLYGIKMLNLTTNSIRHFFGTTENVRFVHLALYQSNKSTEEQLNSAVLFATAFKKNRFYLFTRGE